MEVKDITLIGCGIATTLTLIEVLGELINNPRVDKKVSIAIIEKNHEFWSGIPYGARSSVNALTITSVHDFIYEHERPVFFDWLKANIDEWTAHCREHGGLTAHRWLTNNLPLIEANAWEKVYVPRFLYGNYLKQKISRLIKEVEVKGLAEIALIQAEATDMRMLENGCYEVMIEHPDNSVSGIISKKVVISTGSAPVRKMCDLSGTETVYVNDIYEPSVPGNLKMIREALDKPGNPEDRNLLIIGSNASSIELLYVIEGMPELRQLINKTVIISTSGILPYHTSTEVLENYPLPNLDIVKAAGNYNIETLVGAAMEDLKLALRDGANMDYVAAIISTILKMMEVLGEDAKKAFFAIYAIQLRNMFRRAGPEYKGVAELLIDLEEVELLKGRFINAEPSGSGALLHYYDLNTANEKTYPSGFRIVINCSGSDNLDQCSSRFLYNIVNNHICRMNLSGKGLEVSEKFEAAPNLYVMGPLLGGNVNKLIHFWQLENASRLTSLAPYLSKELLA